MKKPTCPKCGSVYGPLNTCTNKECILSFIPSQESTDWKATINYICRRIRYFSWSDFNSIYHRLRIRLFARYDLIRTGASKWHWTDKDCLMELAMHKLVVDYVEKEEGLKYHHHEKLKDDPNCQFQWENDKQVLQAYIDIKVTTPMMIKVYDELLNKWFDSKSFYVNIDNINKIDKQTKTTEEKENWSNLQKYEKELETFRTELLHRIVDLRGGLWT